MGNGKSKFHMFNYMGFGILTDNSHNFCLSLKKDEKGTDSVAVQLTDEKHWDELVIIIAVVCILFLF